MPLLHFPLNRDKGSLADVVIDRSPFLPFRNPNDFGINKGLANLIYLQKIGREINRRLLQVEGVSHNSGLSGDSIQRVVQPTVTNDGEKAPALKLGQPHVLALFLALTCFSIGSTAFPTAICVRW
jgi:hypothetical protein